MKKLVTIVGARPQFIKAAALSREIRKNYSDTVKETLVHTGQHYDQVMSQVFFEEMEIPEPAYNLKIGSGNHGLQTGEMMKAMEPVFIKEKPDAVIVYGDTNSTLAASVAASKLHIPVIHIEAGLRSFNKSMPEEINRIVTDHVSTLLFSPTVSGIKNLEREGLFPGNSTPYTVDQPGIFHCGDLMYDNSIYFRRKAEKKSTVLEKAGLQGKDFALATIHRPVNTDNRDRLREILEALLTVADKEQIHIVLPLHPRTSKMLEAHPDQELIGRLTADNGIHLVPPVAYLDMVHLEQHSRMILTDSGGVQKEAWFMKKPVVILRRETEWTEITDSGNGILTDADGEKIISAVKYFLSSPPKDFPDIYGNGQAASEIMDIVTQSEWK